MTLKTAKKSLFSNKTLIILTIVLSFSFILRLYKLNEIPTGFSFDEAGIGYNAYTILTTARDEYGKFMPVYFRSFGEYKNPIQIYSTVPLIAIFHLNEFAVRLTSVLYGVASIFAIYLLSGLFAGKKQQKTIGIISAVLLSIVPWHFHLSRVALESMMPYLLFTTLGTYFFLKDFTQKNIILSGFFFVLAVYSYFPSRIFIPCFVIALCIIYIKKLVKNWKKTIIAVIFCLILLIPFFQHIFTPGGLERWGSVNIFQNPPENNTIIPHIFNNYLSHFSYDFLFSKGDIDMPGQSFTMYSVRGFGQLYLFQLPFIILGGIYLFWKKKYKSIFVIISWLILYPLGSCFTIETSALATRSIIGVVPFQILTAIGIVGSLSFIKNLTLKRLYIIILSVIIALSFYNYLYTFYTKYPLYSSTTWGWQYGAGDIINYFVENEKNYDRLVMAPEFNASYIYFKFYAPNNCQKCTTGMLDEPGRNSNIRILYAISPRQLRGRMKNRFVTKKYLYYPDGSVAFQIGELMNLR